LRVCLSCGTENLSVSKNFASGQKRRRVPCCAGRRCDLLELRADLAVLEADVVFLAAALDPALEVFRERVDDRDADAVQAAGELVVLVGEFGAGVQRVSMSSAPLTFSLGWMSTGMPRPSSSTAAIRP